jgi:hypothetical protein
MAILPNSTIRRLSSVDNIPCDCCDGGPAVEVRAGECDSFGYEENHLCAACCAKWDAEAVEGYELFCDGCRRLTRCWPRRDPDEGLSGPVYWYCAVCVDAVRKAEHEAWLEFWKEEEEKQAEADGQNSRGDSWPDDDSDIWPEDDLDDVIDDDHDSE